MSDVVHFDIPTCSLTLSEMLVEIEKLQIENPGRVFFFDGDSHSVMSRPVSRRSVIA